MRRDVDGRSSRNETCQAELRGHRSGVCSIRGVREPCLERSKKPVRWSGLQQRILPQRLRGFFHSELSAVLCSQGLDDTQILQSSIRSKHAEGQCLKREQRCTGAGARLMGGASSCRCKSQLLDLGRQITQNKGKVSQYRPRSRASQRTANTGARFSDRLVPLRDPPLLLLGFLGRDSTGERAADAVYNREARIVGAERMRTTMTSASSSSRRKAKVRLAHRRCVVPSIDGSCWDPALPFPEQNTPRS